MFKDKLKKGVGNCNAAVKLGAKQAAQGKPGFLTDVFAMKGRDVQAAKKRSDGKGRK